MIYEFIHSRIDFDVHLLSRKRLYIDSSVCFYFKAQCYKRGAKNIDLKSAIENCFIIMFLLSCWKADGSYVLKYNINALAVNSLLFARMIYIIRKLNVIFQQTIEFILLLYELFDNWIHIITM